MVSNKMYELGSKKSTIRNIFEYGRKRAAVVGEENIFDFSLGNPNVPAPPSVKKAILDILDNEKDTFVHGYTVAPGYEDVRTALAGSINRRFGMDFTKNNLFMTIGAAAAISICFKALANPGDEYITFAPYFPEYKCFVEAAGAKLILVPADTSSFQINFEELEKLINVNTKAIIVNSPNNPSGAVYSEGTIKKLSDLLMKKSKEYNHPIYIICDEPYREIAYENVFIPYIPKFYNNTLVCYSYSKSLSLPGERIGYVAVPNEMEDFQIVMAAIAGAARALGYVNAPTLFQRVIARCVNETSDISIYKTNRDLLYKGLTEMGFSCVKPEGAFYLFPLSLESDAKAFCKRAQEFDLLLVPGDDFGCPGHFRLSYCVQTSTIEKALPVFKKLAESYGIK
ncbi:MAG: pyridoxal phosphate-dependent aminotransferase [Bacillota bacterium]|nr:pyridoxal phosphate-dependent aminotransferase [Bacillota bacterium]